MKYTSPSAILAIAIFAVLSAANVAGQYYVNPFLTQNYEFNNDLLTKELFSTLAVNNRVATFANPTISKFENGCKPNNLNGERFAYGISRAQQVQFCEAFQMVSEELNQTNWSPKLRAELEEIWEVFINENVKIRPMKRGISKRIVLAAEPFTENRSGFDFNASVYIRPEHIQNRSFFLLAMHELRHVYDFHRLWLTSSSLPEAELEKRGFRIMGKIAKETSKKEKLKRLPKVWKDSWGKYEQNVIASKMESTIEKFMRKSSFYKQRLSNPGRYMVSFVNRRRAFENSQQAVLVNKANIPARNTGTTNTNARVLEWDLDVPPRLVRTKPKTTRSEPAKETLAISNAKPQAGRLPDSVKLESPKNETIEKIGANALALKKAVNPKDSDELLDTAVENEKILYYKFSKFGYDQDLKLQCWKNQKVSENFQRLRSINRGETGRPTFQNIKTSSTPYIANYQFPSCLINFESIDSDATETFWSAAYLEEMPIKFNYFTKLNGIDVARYTVYKPARAKFDQIAAKYPNIKPFRVFVGTIFVSVEDSQIIKFWGSSYPQSETTGTKAGDNLANYNTTAVRQKLLSGVWVTTTVSTVAVSTKHGKAKPFSYLVKFENYHAIDEDKE